MINCVNNTTIIVKFTKGMTFHWQGRSQNNGEV